MGSIDLLVSAVIILLIGSAVSFFTAYFKKDSNELPGWISLLFVIVAAVEIIIVSLRVFLNGRPIVTETPLLSVPGIIAHLTLQVDTLSAVFLFLIGLISILSVLFAVGFMTISRFKDFSMMYFYPPILIFFASIIAVVTVNDMLFFFVAWELMTLSSYTLVIFDRKETERLKAGFKYFLYAHVGTAFMIIGAIILYNQGGSFSFDSLSESMKVMMVDKPGIMHLILAFFFIGFATKAGVLPFGDWLRDAYPAAPSPAASIFGGIMSKLGVYGFIRVFCEILPISQIYSQTWGVIIAAFGTISIFIGTMTALVQEDSKKLLSFHVIGQIGYMLLGVGIGIYFLPTNMFIATAAIVAGVFHLVNNALYKSSLFLSAGSIFYKTGERNLNNVGGLSKLMPVTAFVTVIASLSIAGLPPFNGFSSKWLIYQSSIVGGLKSPLFIALGVIAIFISGVTLASFFKFFGASFFGKISRNVEKLEKKDVPFCMVLPGFVYALLCILFGIFPRIPVKILHNAMGDIFGTNAIPGFVSLYGSSPFGIDMNFGKGVFASWNPLFILVGFVIVLVVSYIIYKSGSAPKRSTSTWYCGEEHSDEEVRYQAHSFYLPFKQFFKIRIGNYQREGVYPTVPIPDMHLSEKGPVKRFLNIDKWLYEPIVNVTLKIMRWFSKTHTGMPHVYLLWMFLGIAIGIFILFTLQ